MARLSIAISQSFVDWLGGRDDKHGLYIPPYIARPIPKLVCQSVFVLMAQWFKFYGQEYLSDPKMLGLSASERSCWITLLSYASVNDNPMITFLSEEQLLVQSGISIQDEEWEATKGVLEKFKKLKMIRLDNGKIVITNWAKRQAKGLSAYERVKRYREKKRNDNAMITQMITIDKNRIDKNRIDKNRIDILPTIVGKAAKPRSLEVDKIIQIVKEVTGLTQLDGTIQGNRRFAYLIFRKWKDLDMICQGIKAGAQNDYHRAKMTSTRYVYYHLAEMAREVMRQANKIAVIKTV